MKSKIKQGKTEHIGCRFTENVANLLNQIAKRRGENISIFIRRSVKKELARLSYLSKEDKKALEIEKPEKPEK